MTTPARLPMIPVSSLTPCCAFLCCMNSFIFNPAHCMGLYSKDACCCIQIENLCCKYTDEAGYDCILYRSECMKGSCKTCCQIENQCFCFDFRCQDHKTDEQPCICTVMFFTCYYKDERVCSCCASVPQLEAAFTQNAPANLDLANATAAAVAHENSRRISGHRPHPVTPPTPSSSPRPGSYSPTYVAPETQSMRGRGNYAQVGFPPTPPAVARTVSTRSVSATGGDIPMATVVYA